MRYRKYSNPSHPGSTKKLKSTEMYIRTPPPLWFLFNFCLLIRAPFSIDWLWYLSNGDRAGCLLQGRGIPYLLHICCCCCCCWGEVCIPSLLQIICIALSGTLHADATAGVTATADAAGERYTYIPLPFWFLHSLFNIPVMMENNPNNRLSPLVIIPHITINVGVPLLYLIRNTYNRWMPRHNSTV